MSLWSLLSFCVTWKVTWLPLRNRWLYGLSGTKNTVNNRFTQSPPEQTFVQTQLMSPTAESFLSLSTNESPLQQVRVLHLIRAHLMKSVHSSET